MIEPMMTAVTVKLTLPSNFAENRRGAEVSLSGSFPEGTTCDQARPGLNRLMTEASRMTLAMQSGNIPSEAPGSALSAAFGATAAAPPASAPAPEKTVASRKPKPSEITIPASGVPGVGTPTAAPAQQPAAASISPEPSPAETPFDGPFVGVPTGAPPAQGTALPASVAAPPSIPGSTGMVLGSVPTGTMGGKVLDALNPTVAGATSGPGSSASSVATVPTTVSGGAISPSNPTSAPVVSPGLPQSVAPATSTSSSAPVPVGVASPTGAGTPASVGGDPLADNGEFRKMIGDQMRRLSSLEDGKGEEGVLVLCQFSTSGGPQSAFVPLERRQELLDKLRSMT